MILGLSFQSHGSWGPGVPRSGSWVLILDYAIKKRPKTQIFSREYWEIFENSIFL